MNTGKGALFIIVGAALIMFASREGQADSSAGYSIQGGAARASASVRIAVNIPVKVSMALSPADAAVWSNTEETQSGMFISCGGVGVESDRAVCESEQEVNAVYSITAL